MGGGSSSTKKTENKTVNKTTTTTTIGDIGFTGNAGLQFAEILQAGSIESERIRADSFSDIFDTGGKALQQITQTAKRQSELSNNTIGVLAARASGNSPEDGDDSDDGQRLERLAVIFGGVAVLVTLLRK